MPGSHQTQHAHRDTWAKDNLLSRGQEVMVDVDAKGAVDILLRPGQASLHHVLIVHGSEPNHSADRRIGFAIRYIPTHLHQTVAGPRDSATLVRGVDRYHHFEHEPAPDSDLSERAWAAHRDAAERSAAILYAGGQFYQSVTRENLEIYDRVGGGDGFASGLAYGFLEGKGPQAAVEYGAAHGALAMTTPGDTSMVNVREVEAIMKGKGARVIR